MEKDYLRTEAAADYLSVTVNTFRSFYMSGKLKSYKPHGKLLYFKKADLDNFIESSKEN